jgi:hypothetical protein
MKISRTLVRAVLCVAFALLAGGCTTATSALWDRQKESPADNSHIRLSFDPQRKDILVCYDAHINNDSGVVEKAYWLFASTHSSAAHEQPIFVENPDFGHLEEIPLFHSRKELKHESPAGYSVLAGPTSRSFELWKDGKKFQTYRLPEHSDWGNATAWRVALTPLAVTGDAALTIGLTVGAAAGYSIVATDGQILLLPLELAHH